MVARQVRQLIQSELCEFLPLSCCYSVLALLVCYYSNDSHFINHPYHLSNSLSNYITLSNSLTTIYHSAESTFISGPLLAYKYKKLNILQLSQTNDQLTHPFMQTVISRAHIWDKCEHATRHWQNVTSQVEQWQTQGQIQDEVKEGAGLYAAKIFLINYSWTFVLHDFPVNNFVRSISTGPGREQVRVLWL